MEEARERLKQKGHSKATAITKQVEELARLTELLHKQAEAVSRLYRSRTAAIEKKTSALSTQIERHSDRYRRTSVAQKSLRKTIIDSTASLKVTKHKIDTNEARQKQAQDSIIESVENALGLCMNLDLLVRPDLACRRCEQILTNPISLFPCAHTFCEACLPFLRESSGGAEYFVCLTCSNRSPVDTAFPNEVLDRLVFCFCF